jgi:hypothetical protein
MALVLLGTMGICVAQETADILIGGEIVARVREAGQYESVEHRAAAIDEKINEVLAATDDPGSLEVSLENVDGLWTIMIGGEAIMAVHAAEAEANGMSPEMLGASWVRRIKDVLPGATGAPVTVFGEEEPAVEPVQPLVIADEPVISSPTTGDEPATSAVAPAPPAPAGHEAAGRDEGAVQILEVPATDTHEPEEIVAGQGARLLMLEAFNKARELPEDDYLVRREAMANDLFDNLVQVLTGGRATGRIEETAAAPLPAPRPPVTTPEPAAETAPTTVAAPPPTTIGAAPMPSTVGAVPSLRISSEAQAKIRQAIPANDPSYANVEQKVIIRAKFRAASEALRTADASTAAQAREVLTAARTALTNEQFDASEQYLDTGLQVLGVTRWEHNIDGAMSDFGLGG